MSQVVVTVNGRNYQIACDDGQEAHLTRLAAYIDKRVGELVAAVGQVGDARLLVMSSLLIADELSDAYSDRDALKGARGGAGERLEAEKSLGAGIDAIAQRIEDVAARLEQS
jgi:cell division protein ZapA